MKTLRIGSQGFWHKALKILCFSIVLLSLSACLAQKEEKKEEKDCLDSASKSSTKEQGQKGQQAENCKKPAEKPAPTPAPSPAPAPSGDNSDADVGAVCKVDRFQQRADQDRIKKLDILFVMDTSGSMQDDWERVAKNVIELVKVVPSDTDIHYAVLLGHVGNYQGKLFAPKHTRTVLKSKEMSVKEITHDLHKIFVEAMKINDPGSGESLFHSLYHAVTTKAKENQNLGFFRSDAALSILFMSDEHEIGSAFPSKQDPGIPPRCDEDYEESVRATYYTKFGIDVHSTFAKVKALKGDMPVTTHAMVNITKEDLFRRNSKNARCLYDSLGYGYFTMVEKTKGVLYSIQADRALGMQKIGECTRDALELQYDFKLSWSADRIDPASIVAKVDQSVAAHKYDALANSVHIEQPGGAGSLVEISYCAPVVVKDWTLTSLSSAAGENSVAISWQTAEQATKGYVRWGLSANALANRSDENSYATNHSMTIAGLAPDTIYYFQVVARDEKGLEKQSAILDVRTLKGQSPDPEPIVWQVENLLGASTTNSVNLSWNTQNVLTRAVVNYGLSASALTQSAQETSFAINHELRIEGLSQDTLYYFQVVANDEQGHVERSSVFSVRTQKQIVPDPEPIVWQVENLLGASTTNSVNLSWNTQNVLTRAVVNYGLSASALTQSAQETSFATNHELRIEGLSQDTVYYFQVLAHDGQGHTESSAIVAIRTQAEVVNPPPVGNWEIRGFDGTTTATSATLIWQTPGAETTGILRVGTSADDLSLHELAVNEAAETQMLTVSGLSPDTQYYFKVIARDSTGRTVESVVIAKRTKVQ